MVRSLQIASAVVYLLANAYRQYLDNIRKHSGAFTDDDYDSINECGDPSSEDRIQFHERMKILFV